MKNDQKTAKTRELQQVAVPNTILTDEASILISQAIDKGVPVDTMERLLVMRRELKAEQAKEKFTKAMASFQAECPIIQKRSKVSYGTTHYSYAPLEDIVEQVKHLLSKYGFSYTFDMEETDNMMRMVCIVTHEGGHSTSSKYKIEVDPNSKMNISQKYGSASTYGKRYAFINAFGILTGDEDTDANEYKPSIKQQLTMPPTVQSEAKVSGNAFQPEDLKITPEQIEELLDITYRTGRSKLELEAFIYDAFHVKTVELLTKDQAYKLIARLQKEGKKTVSETEVTEEDLNKMAASIN